MKANGTLTKLSLAWSRDDTPKTYVQDRMREEGADLWDWLQRGAHFYVCGDAKRMAADVEKAIVAIAQAHGGMDEAAAKALRGRSEEGGAVSGRRVLIRFGRVRPETCTESTRLILSGRNSIPHPEEPRSGVSKDEQIHVGTRACLPAKAGIQPPPECSPSRAGQRENAITPGDARAGCTDRQPSRPPAPPPARTMSAHRTNGCSGFRRSSHPGAASRAPSDQRRRRC